MHTWDERSMPTKCHEGTEPHYYVSEKLQSEFGWNGFREGSFPMKPYAIKAGETVELLTKWNWNNQNVARDWSVTAWGDKGKVTVAHD